MSKKQSAQMLIDPPARLHVVGPAEAETDHEIANAMGTAEASGTAGGMETGLLSWPAENIPGISGTDPVPAGLNGLTVAGILAALAASSSPAETQRQKLNRSYGELLQELRVAITGLQVLLAFLLTLAFTPRFHMLTQMERNLYVITVVTGTVAAALLMAPAAFHRIVTGCGLKRKLLTTASRLALCGLALIPLAIGGALMLTLGIVIGTSPAMIVGAGVLAWFALIWFLFPIWCRLRRDKQPA